MSRISETFARLESEGRKALIPFVTCGDPNTGATLAILHAMVEKGADIIEVGVPFSDPMADGPAIQLANERALKHNVGLSDVFDVVAEFRKTNNTTPIVLMGYLNPIEWMGYEVFSERAGKAGVDGLITVDLPPEEASEFSKLVRSKGIDPIYLLTPATAVDRARKILEAGSGYVYYVSVKGVTGSAKIDVTDVAENVARLKNDGGLPVVVGFGIKDPETAAAVAAVSDGSVVGSVLVNRCGELESESNDEIASQVSALIGDMRQAMDAA